MATKRPGFDNSAGNRNRRVNRYGNNGADNNEDRRHKEVRDITIAFVNPDQITDSANRLAQFENREFIEVELTTSNDGVYEVDTAVAGQIDTIEQTIAAEGAGSDFLVKSLHNREFSRADGAV